MKLLASLFHVMVVIFLVMYFTFAVRGTFGPLLFMAMLNCFIASAIFVSAALLSPQRLFVRFFALFNFVFLGLIPLLLQFQGTNFPYLISFSEQIQIRTILCIIISQVFFLGGAFAAFRFGVSIPRLPLASVRQFLRREPSVKVVGVLGLGLTLLGIFLVGGPQALLVSRDEFSESIGIASRGIFAIQKYLITAPIAISTIVTLSRLVRGRLPLTLWNSTGFAGLFVVCLFANNPLFNSRFWCGTVFLGIALCFFRYKMPAIIRWLPGIAALSLLFLFPFADVFRRSGTANISERFAASKGVAIEVADKGDFSMYLQVIAAIQLTDDRGIDYGRQIIGACLFWVPRTLWRDKPESTGGKIATTYGLQQSRLATPLVAEAYHSFAYFGVSSMFFSLGWLLTCADNTLMDHSRSPNLLVLLLFLCPLTMMLLRGSLLVATANITYSSAFYLVLISASIFASRCPIRVKLV